MVSKIPEEIHALVPKELRHHYGIYWSSKSARYYVYRDLANPYDSEKKRSKVVRLPLGSIKDGVFTYSPKYLSTLQVEKLKEENAELKAAKKLDPKVVREVHEVVKVAPDPRKHAKKVLFPLDAVLTVVLLSSFAGRSSAVSAAIYWRQHKTELQELIPGFPSEDISHDTINRILRLLSPEHFHKVLKRLTSGLITEAVMRVFNIDGQAVKASKTPSCPAGRYIFNAYNATDQMLAASLLIEEKTNEISSVIKLVSMLDLRQGDIITADAMNTQKELAKHLVGRNAGYCLAVKENQPKLLKEIRYLFETADPSRIRQSQTLDVDHGRIEERTMLALPANLLSNTLLEAWPGLKNGCILKGVNKTEKKNSDEEPSYETRFFITTVPYAVDVAESAAKIVRSHWAIENNLHYGVDVNFNQDRMQCTDENYLTNRATLNKMALALLAAAQKALEEKGNRYSVKTLQQLCSTPAGVIETMGTILGWRRFLEEVKG